MAGLDIGEPQKPDHLLLKAHLLPDRIEEGDEEIRPDDLQHQPRKTGAGTDIEKPGIRRDVRGRRRRIEEVLNGHRQRIGNGGQVDAAVPADQLLTVNGEPVGRFGGNGDTQIGPTLLNDPLPFGGTDPHRTYRSVASADFPEDRSDGRPFCGSLKSI